MFDIDKYHKVKLTEGPWKYKREADTEDGDYRIYIVAPMGDYWIESAETTVKLYGAQGRIAKMLGEHTYGDAQLMVDAPLLLEEVKRLRKELDKQMEYIEWLEEFAPKAGEYNLPWDAYELAKGIHWTQMEKEE
tara:strand:- start:97 stop:498 length:402 start_codon:yes stop_codon:yes gene_type:complete